MAPQRWIVALAVLCVAPPLAAAAPPSSAEDAAAETPPRPYGLAQLRFDSAYLVRRPLDRRERKRLVVVAGVTAGLYLLRDEIRDRVRDNRSPGRSRFLQDVRHMGKGFFAPALALVAYGSSFATGNPREKETAWLLLESQAYSAAAAAVGSFVIGAERPRDGDSLHVFDTDGHGVSLDAALAASVVEPLRRQYLRVREEDRRWKRVWKRAASAALYAGAALTAYSRLDTDSHWAPDAFLGAAAGLGVGRALCDAHDEARARRGSVIAGPGPSGRGVSVLFRLDARPRRTHHLP